MRALLVCLVPALAWAQNIGGTFTANFVSFNQFGVPTTHLALNLTCTLTCSSSAPTLHYGVNGGVDGWFASDTMTMVGYVGSGFGADPSGSNAVDTTSFPPGSAFTVKAKSATCWCGNITGQGGFIDVVTPVTTIPPWLATSILTPKAGEQWTQILNAQPKGSESVAVHVLGGGLDQTITLNPTDFPSSGTSSVNFTPTQPGDVVITATLQPYGAAYSRTITVQAGSGGTGGGGGTSGTGGGSGGGAANGGGGDNTRPDAACAAGPAGVPLALLALALLRRRRAQRP